MADVLFVTMKFMENTTIKKLLFPVLGVFSIISQTILLRELMIGVNGNEIIFSIFLSLWLLIIALGSLWGNKLQSSIKKVTTVFSLFSILLPTQFYLIPLLINQMNVIQGELISIPLLIMISIIVITPGSLLLGLSFPLLCKQLNKMSDPVHKGYVLEAIGMIIGSILLIILLSFFSHFQIIFLLSSMIFLFLYFVNKRSLNVFLMLLFLICLPFSQSFYQQRYAKKYGEEKLTSSKNSQYGRLDVTFENEQQNYYWNGGLLANSQNDRYAQQLINFVMLQHKDPQKILLIGGALSGFIPIIKQCDSVKSIDCISLEKNILRTMPKFDLVNKITGDAIHYLRESDSYYDLIFCDLPMPTTLNLNRFYTTEFFTNVKDNLKNKNSVFALTLESGANFMTSDIAALNSSVINAFAYNYKNFVVIPSLKNLLIGSNNDHITNNVDSLTTRAFGKLQTWFNYTTIWEKCNELEISNFHSRINEVNVKPNSISNPVAYFYSVKIWSDIQDLDLFSFSKLSYPIKIIIVVLVFIIIGLLFKLFSFPKKFKLNFSIFSISFCNFILELILLNYFQMNFGYVYFMIVFFSSSFMLGLIIGFTLQRKYRFSLKLLLFLNLILVILMYFYTPPIAFTYLIYNILFAGLEGAILSNLLSWKFDTEKLNSSGRFYYLDSIGATFGGLLSGIILFPLFGFKHTLLILMLTISFILIIHSKKRI